MSAGAAAAERDSNNIIERQLTDRLDALQTAANADVLSFIGLMYPPADDLIKDAIEVIPNRRDALMVVLETSGGYVSVSERVARIFRHHYSRVDFVVPSYAMSAGTVLAMSGDNIYMDYASVLGPIDPQIDKGGGLVPALGYLEQYERFVKKSADGTLTTAELAYFIQNFDAAELYRYEQERELSIALLEEWLVKFKFKNWTKTETRKKTVTKKMRTDRAKLVGNELNNTGRWHSHGRGIPMEVLRRDLKLLIEDFGKDPKLGPPIQAYFHLLKDYMMRRGHNLMVLHTREDYVGF